MRPSLDEYFLSLAALIATRGTCLRRKVGCVLVNKRGHVLATGYNGNAAGLPHCNEMKWVGADYRQLGDNPEVQTPQKMVKNYPNACAGSQAKSGTDLDLCEAIHAEANALLQCRDVWDIRSCYVTVSPCVSCVKLLMNTGCERIVFIEPYSHGSLAQDLWGNREWVNFNPGLKSRGVGAV